MNKTLGAGFLHLSSFIYSLFGKSPNREFKSTETAGDSTDPDDSGRIIAISNSWPFDGHSFPVPKEPEN